MASERTRVSGWPAELTRVDLGDRRVELVTVASLESLVDRDRLLSDDDFEPPYWALVWSGSKLLAEWLLATEELASCRVLDVGCGLGLIAVAAAQAGAQVTAVDRDADAIAFVRASAAHAAVDLEILVGDVADAVRGREFDVVVAAELLYERTAFGVLAGALSEALSPNGRLYLADASRVDTRDFYRELATVGLRCAEERTEAVDEEGTRVRVRLSQYTRSDR